LSRVVVDASVIAKWRFPEPHAEAALRLLKRGQELWTPDLVWAELGNITWKKWRRNEIDEGAARDLLRSFQTLPLLVFSSKLLATSAWFFAHTFNRSFYDSLYLALAVHQECPMVTADRRLYDAIKGASPQYLITWVEEVP
jgi:predicted nucleic acid-binding protein